MSYSWWEAISWMITMRIMAIGDRENLGDCGCSLCKNNFVRLLKKICQSHNQKLYFKNFKFETKCWLQHCRSWRKTISTSINFEIQTWWLSKRFYILYMYLLKNQGLKQYLVDRAPHSGFTIKDYTAKEDLNTQKPVLFYLLT